MNAFDDAAGPPSRRVLERLLARLEAEVDQTYRPLGELGTAIVTAAWDSQQRLGPAFGFTRYSTPSEPQMLLQYELLYFFSHLALRSAVAEGFTEPQIAKLQTFLGPLIVSTATDSFCLHWPEDLKRKMWGEIYERLNDAEMEYAECRGLFDPNHPLNRGTLIGRLATNAVAFWDLAPDDPAASSVAVAVKETFVAAGLKERVRAALRVVDRVDVDAIKSFWKR